MCDTLRGFILYLIYVINYVWGLGCYISGIRAGRSIRPGCLIMFACTTTGTSILAYASKCAIVPVSGFRNSQGKYELIADQSIEGNYPQNDEKAAAAYMNKFVEEIILRAPEQWMWLHKRFKSLPDETQTNARYQ